MEVTRLSKWPPRRARQWQITVPNFVPFVPEIVPYLDVNPFHSMALSRILL
jgi:hypothetical protein